MAVMPADMNVVGAMRTVTLRVRGINSLRVRIVIARWLIVLAARVANMGIEFEMETKAPPSPEHQWNGA